MHSVAYAAGYSDRYLAGPPAQEADGPLELQANRWSSLFGHALLNYMKDGATDALDITTLRNYTEWFHDNTGTMLNASTSDTPSAHTLHFHGLNSIMLDMWQPIAGTVWSESHRQYFLKTTQDTVATRGLELYIQKLRIIKDLKAQGENYFDARHEPIRSRVEGNINEYDAAVVLLGIAGILEGANVVPGPQQLENGSNSAENVDFVFMHEDQVVGIQVKSSILSNHANHYDRTRVVPIDGRIDMGNEKMARIDDKSSRANHVSWAGLVSAAHVMNLNIKNPNQMYFYLGGGQRRSMMQYKMHAKEALHGTKSRNLHAQQVIGRRIIEALYPDEA